VRSVFGIRAILAAEIRVRARVRFRVRVRVRPE